MITSAEDSYGVLHHAGDGFTKCLYCCMCHAQMQNVTHANGRSFYRLKAGQKHLDRELCAEFDSAKRKFDLCKLNPGNVRSHILGPSKGAETPLPEKNESEKKSSPSKPYIGRPRKQDSVRIVAPSSLKEFYMAGMCWMPDYILNEKKGQKILLSDLLLNQQTVDSCLYNNDDLGCRSILGVPIKPFDDTQRIRFHIYGTVVKEVSHSIDGKIIDLDRTVPAYKILDLCFSDKEAFAAAVEALFHRVNNVKPETGFTRKFNHVLLYGEWHSKACMHLFEMVNGYLCTGRQFATCIRPERQIYCIPDSYDRVNSVKMVDSEDPDSLISSTCIPTEWFQD